MAHNHCDAGVRMFSFILFPSSFILPIRFWLRAQVWSACESTFRNGIPTPRWPRCNGGLTQARDTCHKCHADPVRHVSRTFDPVSNCNVFLIRVKCFAYYHDWVGVDRDTGHGDSVTSSHLTHVWITVWDTWTPGGAGCGPLPLSPVQTYPEI